MLLKALFCIFLISQQTHASFVPALAKIAVESVAVATTRDALFCNPSFLKNGELKKALSDLKTTALSMGAVTSQSFTPNTSNYIALAALLALSLCRGTRSVPLLASIVAQNMDTTKLIGPAATLLNFLLLPQLKPGMENRALAIEGLTRAGVRTFFDVYSFKRLLGLSSSKQKPYWLKRFIYHCGILASTYALFEKKWQISPLNDESVCDYAAKKTIQIITKQPVSDEHRFLKSVTSYALGSFVILPIAHELVEWITDQVFSYESDSKTETKQITDAKKTKKPGITIYVN